MPLDAAWAIAWTRLAAATISEHREELSELDRLIGDADHGDNLDRGYRAAVSRLDSTEDPGAYRTPGAVLKAVATTLLATVGGAAGPLLGTAYLRASRVADAEELGPQGIADLLEEATSGIEVRGRAEVGDKTMIDAWRPAARVAAAKAAAGATTAEVLEAAAAAAAQGAIDTEPLVARKGRASYLGPRSKGHRDPGAASCALILAAAAAAARGEAA